MSNEQRSHEDDQGVESAVVERRSPFERIAEDLNRRDAPPANGPASALVTEMCMLLGRYERETAARAVQGDAKPYDVDPYSDILDLAVQFEHARENEDPTVLERFLDDLAGDLDLADVRSLRMAAVAAAEAMGRIALAAREKGMSPDRIAAESGYTASRIAQFIREEKQRRGDSAK
ncbi:hypothetical protein BJP40_08405 [Streptomyces sp. CC53]|uniref:hypothetical protein n=1 Tax=Streptomyces sp. CC53 TaxID=1906740 RepID=UPI0008DD604F|nr:hypothetical protein [Streptomyces sp. CC53]OII60873.1 hypothetical protein BJP40_08405 [Streptomyces sp. CC53]